MRNRHALLATLAVCLVLDLAVAHNRVRAQVPAAPQDSNSARVLGQYAAPQEEGMTLEVEAADEGPHVFLGGPIGSFWLDGKSGSDHYVYKGFTWKFDLVFERKDANYYYYHEKGFNTYKWAFSRHISGNNTIQVWHKFPEHTSGYVTFESAYITILRKAAVGTRN